MYVKLKMWVHPTSFTDMSLNQIVDHLKTHTSSETVEIAERCRFFKRLQQQCEGVVEYVTELCKLEKPAISMTI